jgi:predicted outer membrane repeat protein
MFNNDASNPTVINCVFTDNSTMDRGGGMHNRGEQLDDSCPNVINCVFSGNTAITTGGGMYTDNDEAECDPIVTNCIFWQNTGGITVQAAQIDGDSSVVTFSCIQDTNANDGSIPFGGASNNNIDDDPLFADVAQNNFRLSHDSPCIELGSNAAVPADVLDIDGNGSTSEPIPLDLDLRSRFSDGDCDGTDTVDMGAYEFGWIYIGDLDGDCDVDFADFAIIANHWLAGVE